MGIDCDLEEMIRNLWKNIIPFPFFFLFCTDILKHTPVKDGHLQNKWERAHRILYRNLNRIATCLNEITDKSEYLFESNVQMLCQVSSADLHEA